MFVSHHTLKWTRTCRSHGRHPHAHTAHFLLNRHTIGVDETSYRKGHKYMTVVVDHDRGRVIWMHQGHGQKVFDELVKLFVYGTYLRLLLFSWVRSWVVVVGCRVHRIGA